MYLITIPHGLPRGPNNSDHSCDSSAVEFAEYIATGLPNSQVIHADANRTQCDLNRAPCMTPAKRHMLTAMKLGVILLDIHSYPHGEKTDNTLFVRGSMAHKTNAWSCDIFFIVCDAASMAFFTKILARVHEALPAYDIKGFMGNKKADLINQASRRGLLGALIEAGEHLSSAQLKELAAAICAALAS